MRASRLTSILGLSLAALAIPASAHAATPADPASTSTTHQVHADAAADCGSSVSDYSGMYTFTDVSDAAVAFDGNGSTMAFYMGQPAGSGTYTVDNGTVTMTFGGFTATSDTVSCDTSTQATEITGADSNGDPFDLVRR
jgi:hypothetical protein